MALEGNTGAYSLVDVFQFILINKYEGTLVLESQKKEISLFFSKKRVMIPLKKAWFQDPDLLYKVGLTDKITLHHARYFEDLAGAPPLGLLLHTSLIEASKTKRALADFVEKELYHLFDLESEGVFCDYIFYKDDFFDYTEKELSQGFVFFTEEILQKAQERFQKLQGLLQSIPNDVYISGPTPPEGDRAKMEKFFRGTLDLERAAQENYLDKLLLYSTVDELLKKSQLRPLDSGEYIRQVESLIRREAWEEVFRFYFHSLTRSDSAQVTEKIGSLFFDHKTTKSLPFDQILQGPKKVVIKTKGTLLIHFLSQALRHHFPLAVKISNTQGEEWFFQWEEKAFFFGAKKWTDSLFSLLVARGILSEGEKKSWAARNLPPSQVIDELKKSGLVSKKETISFMEERFLDLLGPLYCQEDLQVELFPPSWPSENLAGARYGFGAHIQSLSDKFFDLFQSLYKCPQMDEMFLMTKGAEGRPSPKADLREFLIGFGQKGRSFGDVLSAFYPKYDFRQVLHLFLSHLDSNNLRKITLEETRQFLQLHFQMKKLDDLKPFVDTAKTMGYTHQDQYCAKIERACSLALKFEDQQAPTLRGDLCEFSLADILQTLVRGKLTGTLTLQAEEKSKDLYFHRGELHILRKEDSETDKATRSMFLATQAIVAFSEAVSESLDEAEAVTEEEISEELASQVKEEIYEFFFQEEGTFCFRRRALPLDFALPPKKVKKIKLNAQDFLSEASNRLVLWFQMLQAIPTDKTIFHFLSPENKQKALATGQSPQVLYLIDGTHNVEHIIRASRQRRFDVYNILMHLLHGKYIAPLPSRQVFDLAMKAKEKGDFELAKSYHTYLLKVLPDDAMVIELTKRLFMS